MRLLLLLAVVFCQPVCAVAEMPLLDRYADKEIPAVARQENARALLNLWQFASPELAHLFDISDEEGLQSFQEAVNHLISQTTQTSPQKLSTAAEHYCVYVLARTSMVLHLDFSEPALRHFYKINPGKYPCESAAEVSELVVPLSYTDSLGTTAVLEEIQQRLKEEPFARIAYMTSDRFGRPDTGYVGRVTPTSAGEERFQLYKEVWNQPKHYAGKAKTAGPFKTTQGYLFVEVRQFAESTDDCYRSYRSRVVQDYGRQWLKKIYSDTLATATAELEPEVFPFTTGTAVGSTAYSIAEHKVSFAEAREMLPFLLGDQRDRRFWQSIQRQALEVELIYHGSAGSAIRRTSEYVNLCSMLVFLQEAAGRLPGVVSDMATTENLRLWYEDNKEFLSETQSVSYTLYFCAETSAALADGGNCAAALSKLRERQGNADAVSQEIGVKDVPSAKWASLSREIQVAIQELKPGEWSEVFTYRGRQQVLQLHSLARELPEFEDIQQQVRQSYILEKRKTFWNGIMGGVDPFY